MVFAHHLYVLVCISGQFLGYVPPREIFFGENSWCLCCYSTVQLHEPPRRYSNQKESKSRQNPCQIQAPENIGKLSASRRCLWVRTTDSTCMSGVLPAFHNLKYEIQRRLYDVLPTLRTRRLLWAGGAHPNERRAVAKANRVRKP